MSIIHASNFGDGTNTVGADYILNGSAKNSCRYNQAVTTTTLSSINTSSITDGGTGTATITLTNNMSDSNYNLTGSCEYAGIFNIWSPIPPTSSAYVIRTQYNFVTAYDYNYVSSNIHGDLA